MALKVKEKNASAVTLGREGGKKGGPARAAKLTPEERSDSARNAVMARWEKHKNNESVPGAKPALLKTKPVGDSSKKALDLCLQQIKEAENENEVRRLTAKLQRIVFRKQYQNVST